MYDTTEYVSQMLQGSIILVDGKPACVTSVLSDPIRLVVSTQLEPINWEREQGRLDYRSLSSRLGYMNYISDNGTTVAVLFTRRPVRRATSGAQGINTSNTVCQYPLSTPGIRVGPFPGPRDSLYSFAESKGFYDMIIGEYPEISEASKMLFGETPSHSVAFSRNFCLKNIGWSPFPCVARLGVAVGSYNKKMGSIALTPDYDWVAEELESLNLKVEM